MPEWSKGSRLGRDTKVRGFKPHSAHLSVGEGKAQCLGHAIAQVLCLFVLVRIESTVKRKVLRAAVDNGPLGSTWHMMRKTRVRPGEPVLNDWTAPCERAR